MLLVYAEVFLLPST